MTDTIVPKSDQLNADDLMSGPVTVTITDVRKNGTEQPIDVHLAEFPGRPFRPSKSMRRVMVAAWGSDGSGYVGKSMTLFRDPKVKWGGQEVGGIRISHMTDLDRPPLRLALTETKGKRAPFVVQALAVPTRPAQRAAGARPDGITPEKVTELGAAMTEELQLTERDQKLQWLTEQLERPIKRPTDLTAAEGERLLELIRALTEPPADWQPETSEPTEDGAR